MPQELEDFEGLPGPGMRLCGDAVSGPMIEIDRNGHCGTISLFGAHVLKWQPASHDPVLWLSEGAKLDRSKGIRGGIPVCWPWFADHAEQPDLPAHGFARTTMWPLDWVDQSDPDLPITLTLPCLDSQTACWPHASRPSISYAIGDSLEVELTTTNIDPYPIDFSQALHTYLAVGDVERITIGGLEDVPYWDKLTGSECPPTNEQITIFEEIDRIYRQPRRAIKMCDEVLGRTIMIEHEGASSVIVWNPWNDKSVRLGDMGPADAYRGMVCIETGNVAPHRVRLQPGEAHTLRTKISVTKRDAH